LKINPTSDDEIFLGSNGWIALPPLRWAARNQRLTPKEVSFKSPESLSLNKTGVMNLEHRKYIWKVAMMQYYVIQKKLPWNFYEANGNNPNTQISPQSILVLRDYIFRNINRPSYEDSHPMTNAWLKRALVFNPVERIDYEKSMEYLTRVILARTNPNQNIGNSRLMSNFGGGINIQGQSQINSTGLDYSQNNAGDDQIYNPFEIQESGSKINNSVYNAAKDHVYKNLKSEIRMKSRIGPNPSTIGYAKNRKYDLPEVTEEEEEALLQLAAEQESNESKKFSDHLTQYKNNKDASGFINKIGNFFKGDDDDYEYDFDYSVDISPKPRMKRWRNRSTN